MKKNYTAIEMTFILPGGVDILTASGGMMAVSNLNDLNEDKASFNDLFR